MSLDPLALDYDASSDILTIEGIRYSGIVFREFGRWLPPGAVLRFVKREDGAVTIERLSEPERESE